MTDQLRQALAALHFNSADGPNDVWHVSPSHVDGLHTRAQQRIHTSVLEAKHSDGSSPIGLALQGQKGVGKTHLLGGVRQVVQREGGYFFLIDITTGDAFWEDVVEAMRSELLQKNDDGELQLTELLKRLCDKAAVPDPVARAILGHAPLTTDALHGLVGAIRQVDARAAVECGDTIRALVLYAALDSKQAIGKDYLAGLREANDGDRQAWGIHPRPKPHRALVTEISRVLSLTGPGVVAIDQLDSLINKKIEAVDEQLDPEVAKELALIADGLMQLRETTRRTVSVVACLPDTWKLLTSVAADTVGDRFTETPILGAIADPRLGQALVEKWLGVIYARIGFTPPHPTWPVASSAFGDSWATYTPRQLLRCIQTHAEACVHGEIRELASFDGTVTEAVIEAPPRPGPEPGYLAEFDRWFAELRKSADVDAALSQHTEDAVMPELLQAALRSWINEVGNDDRSWETEPPDGGGQLHAGVRRTLDEERDLAERWMFRAIAPRHGNAVLRKLREARAAAGIRNGVRNRHLVLLHHGPRGWTGATTRKEVKALVEAGSPRLEITKDDVRTLWALKEMLTKQSYELLNWLATRKPASQMTFLRRILPEPTRTRPHQETSRADHQETRPPPAEIVLGMDGEIRIELESLRKHAVIFAGSGTGKTVLLRRIVEECALRGVSAIVLDPIPLSLCPLRLRPAVLSSWVSGSG